MKIAGKREIKNGALSVLAGPGEEVVFL